MAVDMIVAGAVALAASLCLIQIIRLWTGPLSHLPGTTISKFTKILSKRCELNGTRDMYLYDLHKKYGPVVRVGPNEVSVSDLAATREIHKTAGGFLKSSWYTSFTAHPEGNVFSVRDPAEHTRHRRLLGPTMSESNIKVLQSSVKDKTKLLISQLLEEKKQQGYVDIFRWAHHFATDVIGEMSFGDSFHMLETKEENQYMKDIQIYNQLRTQRLVYMSSPLYELPRIPIFHIRATYETRDRMHSYARQSLDRYRRILAEKPSEAKPMFFSNLIGDKGQKAGFSERQLAIQAEGFITAGTDTTATTLTYLIYMVSSHADVRARLVASLAGLPAEPSNEELKDVAYLNWVIDETLRLFGAAPSPLPRVVPRGGRTLAGHFVPEGQVVSPVAYVLHRDPNIYPEPLAWRPERWEHPTDDMRHAFHPFGGGSRICIGLHLARLELRMATAAFFRAFPDATPAFGIEGFSSGDMELREFFLIKPKGERCLIK